MGTLIEFPGVPKPSEDDVLVDAVMEAVERLVTAIALLGAQESPRARALAEDARGTLEDLTKWLAGHLFP